jgi:hypothetical protein
MIQTLKQSGKAKTRSTAAKQEIKWTAKMLESFVQAERGDWEVGDINNFWRL